MLHGYPYVDSQPLLVQDHQIVRLPRKITLMIDVRHIRNVIYNARSNRCHPPTWPNTAPATQNDSHEWCPSRMKRHLQSAEQQVSSSNVTKYCTCHAKWISWVMSVTDETSSTLRGATGVIHQPDQILPLPHKLTLMSDVPHIWNVIYNARSNSQPHQILRLPHKMALQNLREICRKQLKRHLQLQWRTIRAWSEHELVISHLPIRRGYFSRFGGAFGIENYNISRTGYLPKFHQILRPPRKVTLQDHQILRLPRKWHSKIT